MPHALVESSDTQKSLCFKRPPSIHYYLSGYIKYALYQREGNMPTTVCWCWKLFFAVFFVQIFKWKSVHNEKNDHLLPLWSSLKVKVSASVTVLLPCLQRFLLSHCLQARCVMMFLKMTSGKQLGLKFDFFSLSSLYFPPSLPPWWNDRSFIVSENTKEPKGCNSSSL